MSTDYKDTVFLPKTEFPMRAGLPHKEPELLARWQAMDLYARQREISAGREKFILHDGPPYANGNLHIGHALNKILKDVINRSQQMLGKDANYVPGWDCHGLPIEWKVEENYRAAGKNKDEVPIVEFRDECREFAQHWVGVQSDEFQRLGVIGDWKGPYTTMAFHAEAQIAREIMKFATSGQLYRGSKPVMWSVVEKTALAEAEVEYEDYVSDQIWARFPLLTYGTSGGAPAENSDVADQFKDASVVIWTTTPWTIPGNRAICFSSRIAYGLYEVTEAPDDNWAKTGDRLILADALAEMVMKQARAADYQRVMDVTVDHLNRMTCAHPLAGLGGGYGFAVPLLDGDHVTDDAGTGFVHTAPGHGADDFEIWIESEAALKARGIDTRIPFAVAADGSYTADAPGFEGRFVITTDGEKGDANAAVIEALKARGALIALGRLSHQYPHSWRSKKPVIFRNTPQWFIAMGDELGADGLRAKALKAIDETKFYPPSGQNRLRGMIEARPDWVISRQRAWGVPITLFVDKASGEVLRDDAVNGRIVDAFEADGADAWFSSPAARFLGNDYDADDYEQVRDIADVWFDSGATHAFVLEERPDLQWPATLYLEGSDQHRGWFHSSLLESCGTRGRAPYDGVLTHGFVMAEDGRKMSKSLGNIVAPQDVIEQYGADILRIWVVGSDYSEDLRIGPEILKYQADLYRRVRNTLRYLLGNLDGFEASERVAVVDMPEFERWVMHRVWEIDAHVRRCAEEFDFHTMWTSLHNFCAVDLSAFYFDVRKDCLYCDAPDSLRRRACRTVLDVLFSHLTTWLAPVLCFTAEEAWLTRTGDAAGNSVHLRTYPEADRDWRDDALDAKWAKVRRVRRVVTSALELARAEKKIGSSLEASPAIYLDGRWDEVAQIDWPEIAITSGAKVYDFKAATVHPDPHSLPEEVPGVVVGFEKAQGNKCVRCWQVLPDVGAHGHDGICGRCAAAVDKRPEAAE